MRGSIIALLIVLNLFPMLGNGLEVRFEKFKGSFPILEGKNAASIYYDANDAKVCGIAGEDLADDVERVTGVRPEFSTEKPKGDYVILIGTIENNAQIKALIENKRIDVSAIKGEWESGVTQVVNNPFPNVKQALVIAGSDRRGAAFSVYELSKKIGVSPWYWWADVPAKKHEELFVSGNAVLPSPSVKYRGIFINDEDWGMHLWARHNFSPEDKGIGPKVYERVFELLLRLKANHLWPAMHACTRAFNSYPENKVLADEYAIVMGASHCEQMLRNNVWEWHNWRPSDGSKRGKWDWKQNGEHMTEYWADRMAVNGKYENIYTTGLRAVHDEPMNGNVTPLEKAKILQDEVIPAQRQLIKEYVNENVTEVPQIFCPYKEVLEYYELGLEVPEDVTLMWPDDNYAYLRRLSTEEERKREGGAGVYYHVSYFTGPWLWLCTTPPSLIWEEMHKAYEYGADNVWVLNVGDLKPAENATDLFLEMAWDIDKYDEKTIANYLEDFYKENFPPEFAEEIADIKTKYYQLGQSRKPEHMTYFWDYRLTEDREPEFSPFHYGDEIEKRIDAYYSIMHRADSIYDALPTEYQPAYYQLVAYPVRASAFFNKKAMYARKSRIYAKMGRGSADWYAAQAKTAYELIRLETEHYNKIMLEGKWDGMMNDNVRNAPNFGPPKVATASLPNCRDMGIIVEGSSVPYQGNGAYLPTFDKLQKKSHFIDIFKKASQDFEWRASVSKDWIKLSKYRGKVVNEKDERLWVSIDWDKVPEGKSTGQIVIKEFRTYYHITVMVDNTNDPKLKDFDGFVEINNCVSIEAENYNRKRDAKEVAWSKIANLGREGDVMTPLPSTADSYDLDEFKKKAPALEYDVYFKEEGDVTIQLNCLPTHAANPDKGLRYAIAFDNEEPQIVEYDTKEYSRLWLINVLRSSAYTKSQHYAKAGKHTLKIWMVDPAVVLDKIMIYKDDLPENYLGPEETRYTNK